MEIIEDIANSQEVRQVSEDIAAAISSGEIPGIDEFIKNAEKDRAVIQRRILLDNISEINSLAARLEAESRRLKSRAASLSKMLDDIEKTHEIGRHKSQETSV